MIINSLHFDTGITITKLRAGVSVFFFFLCG